MSVLSALESSPIARRRLLRAAVVSLGLGPLVGLGVAAASDGLGANPIEAITHFSGEWALRFLVLCAALAEFAQQPDSSQISWREDDGEGRTDRVGAEAVKS